MISDSKQSEYYSDYCIYGLERATPFEATSNAQPNGTDATTSDEKWYYVVQLDGSWIKIRMRLTEDQRQICTGTGLQNRYIGDDCETSASAMMAIFRTLMIFKAYCDVEGITTLLLRGGSVAGMAMSVVVQNAVTCFFPENLFPRTEGMAEYYGSLVLLLCQSMVRIAYDLDLAIGSASAASVGGEPHLCGHCYCLLKTSPLGKLAGHAIQTGTLLEPLHGVLGIPSAKYQEPRMHVVEGNLRLAKII